MGNVSGYSEISVPELEDLLYMVEDPSGTPTPRKITGKRLLGLLDPGRCNGRLTLESGVAVSASDQTAKSTLYFTPFGGNRVALYDGTRWNGYVFTERSLSLSSLTDAKNYDAFLYDNAGTLTLELSAAWTDDATRADALTTQDGILVKSGATTRRYLGTLRTTGTTTTEDSEAKRFVWNFYNRVSRSNQKIDTGSHSVNNTAKREWGGVTTNRAECVVGQTGVAVPLTVQCRVTGGGTQPNVVIYPALNSTSTEPNGAFAQVGSILLSSQVLMAISKVPVVLALGRNYMTILEAEFASVAATLDYGRVSTELFC